MDEITPTALEQLRQRAAEIHRRLLQAFGRPDWSRRLSPLEELVSTILSQNTNDRNRDLAYENLRARFPTWEAVRDADPAALIDAIRQAGLANQKGPRIQSVLRQITEERGQLNLDFLRSYPPQQALDWLLRFKGVGPKTASIVLQFALDLPAFPVDTHIYRVSGRLGLRPAKMTVEQAHEFLAGLFPPAEYGPAHINLILLGRRICHARRPDCPACPLQDLCDYYQQQSSAGQA